MRILFPAGGGRPHLYPLVPLAWACRAAGHDVLLVSTPAFAEDLAHTGLPGATVGGPPVLSDRDARRLVEVAYDQPPWPADWPRHLDLLDDRQLDYLRLMGEYTVVAAAAMADGLLELARHWRPDLVVYDGFALAGAVCAAALRVPAVRHMYGSQSVPAAECDVRDGSPLPSYARLFERCGAVADSAPALVVNTVPPSMHLGIEVAHQDMRPVPHNGPGLDIGPSLHNGPRLGNGPGAGVRVCVTWGHTAANALGEAAAALFREVIAVLASDGVEVLVATGRRHAAVPGALPGAVRVLVDVPLRLLLPSCAAIVHQGGDGTTLSAAALGVPQLVLTRKPNDDLTGGLLAGTGAGIHLRQQHLRDDPARGRVLREALAKLLTDGGYRRAAQRLGAEIEAQPAPSEVAAMLPALCGGR